MNRKLFFNLIRDDVNLTTKNVYGTQKVIDYGAARGTENNDLAYILATAWWETGQEVAPIEEHGSLKYLKSKRYYPYYGRSLVQLTWDYNYRRMAVRLGLPENTFIDDPDLLLEWEYALPILFIGMEEGIFTGRDLDDYIDDIDEPDEEDLREFANARRIVNGTDKQIAIGKLALMFEHALRAAGYEPIAENRPAEQPGGGQTPPPAGNDTSEPAAPPRDARGRLWPWAALAAVATVIAIWLNAIR